ncbi:MAG: hypothetical protein KDD58_05535 [Bdellovibrionales bacterium]|nr:hypothetical protein [Bdellovibrionales bacterium]
MKSVFLNTFTLQSIVSVAPAIFVIPLMPIYFSTLQSSFISIGILFFIIRFSGIIGSLFSGLFREIIDSKRLCILGELFSFVACVGLLLSLKISSPIVFIISIFVRYFFLSLIMVVRVQWLKELPHSEVIEKTFMVTNIIFQAGFGLTGLVLIFFSMSDIAYLALYMDAGSSLVGATLFYFGKRVELENSLDQLKISFIEKAKALFHGVPLKLMMIEVFIASGIAGTNVLLVQFGKNHLAQWGGYSLSLILYSLFYVLGGLVISRGLKKDKSSLVYKAVIFSTLGLFVSLLLTIFKITSLQLVGFSALFFCYAFFMIGIQQLWFIHLPKASATALFGIRSTIIGSIWALGEIIYDGMKLELEVRTIFFLLATILAFVLLPKLNEQHGRI